jgi:hypothetical protein
VIGLAAASSLGAGLGMFRLPAMQRGVAIGAPETRIYLGWSATWVLAAAVVVAGFMIFIGPGLEWHVQRSP